MVRFGGAVRDCVAPTSPMLELAMLVLMTGCIRTFLMQDEMGGHKVEQLALNRSLAPVGQSGCGYPWLWPK